MISRRILIGAGLVAAFHTGAPLAFAQDGAVKDMFAGFEVGGSRRHGVSRPQSAGGGDSFAISGGEGGQNSPAVGADYRPSRSSGGSKIILPAFPEAATSAVVAAPPPPPPPPQSVPPSSSSAATAPGHADDTRMNGAAKAITNTLSETTAAAAGPGAPGGAPSIDYYQRLIAQAQGRDLEAEEAKKKAVTKPKGVGKDNRF